MSKIDKIIEKMGNNSQNWQIADLENLAHRFGVIIRKGKGSHVTFTHPEWAEILTVPAHRPIKPIYVKKFIMLIEALREEEV